MVGSVTLERGAFVISIDTEMAWGEVDRGESSGYRYSSPEGLTERDVIGAILELFERHDIHATWALVGHLFLDRCDRLTGRPHPEIMRPAYEWLDHDWFEADPGTDVHRDPAWYGSDIVGAIDASPTHQEIGSHTFSHIVVGDPGCSVESLRSELRQCAKLAADRGLTLRSFVHPRNRIGLLEILAEEGYVAYRGKRPIAFAHRSPAVKRLLRAADPVFLGSGSVTYPERVAGMWNLPATSLFSPIKRRAKTGMPIGLYTRQQVRRLRQAARHRGLFHLWFHSHNLTPDPERSLQALEAILAEAARLRRLGELDNPTMGQLAERLDATASSTNPGVG